MLCLTYYYFSDHDGDDDSVNYSPVCSETEDMEVEQDIPSTLTPNLSPQIFEESDDNCGNIFTLQFNCEFANHFCINYYRNGARTF